MANRLVFDNLSLPATMALYDDSKLKGKKNIDCIFTEFSNVISSNCDPFESIKILRTVNSIKENLGIEKITIEEK